MSIGISDLIAGIFKPAAELIDNMHTSTEEKLIQKGRLLEIQAATMDSVNKYNQAIFEGQAKIVHAEASSEHWLVASWRPITMLSFLGLAVFDSFGWLPFPLKDEAWTLLQIGLGGYVVGRSSEKLMKEFKK